MRKATRAFCKQHPHSLLTRFLILSPKIFRLFVPDLVARHLRHITPTAPAPSTTHCACSVCSPDYLPGMIVFLLSLRRHNPWFNYPYFIFMDSEERLSEKDQQLLTEIYPHCHFVDLGEKYLEIKTNNRNNVRFQRFLHTYLGLAAFNIKGFEMVLSLDTDLLCRGDLTPFVEGAPEADFVGVYDLQLNEEARTIFQPYNKNLEFLTLPASEMHHTFNTGVYLIRQRLLTDNHFQSLISLANQGVTSEENLGGDQEIINAYLRSQRELLIAYAPPKFNTSLRTLPRKSVRRFLRKEDPHIIHFLGEKPWSPQLLTSGRYWRARKIWIDEARKMIDLLHKENRLI